jgi:hypothetical protein
VKVQANRPPPGELLAELREWRDEIADLLAAQGRRSGPDVLVGNDDDPEREAMAQHYSAPPSGRPYLLSDHDPLRDGLLAGFRRHSARMAARARDDQPCGQGDNRDVEDH